jgi:metallo-beta-lactamase family protein
MKLKFCGAAGTVTGSRYLLTHDGAQTLVDCGLFQGQKQLRQRNWEELPFNASKVGTVLLTHAHIDHSGYLPVLVRRGFKGRIICTKATLELCQLLLRDSAHLQEEEARYANKRGYSRHKPALPLYTLEDAEAALKLFQGVDYDTPVDVTPGITANFHQAGHILGAAMIMLRHSGRRTLFSGDLGRPVDPVMRPPAIIRETDDLILESTYGNRLHGAMDPEAELGAHLSRAIGRGGLVIIPAFAVGRVQTLLLLISRLKKRGALPDVPIYLNSPMAVDATRIYHEFRSEHRLSVEECEAACKASKFVNSVEESIELNKTRGPGIIISASGMATGGRVVHHLKAFAPDPRNMVLFAGFQAAGTRGAAMVAGAEWIRIHGEDIPVRAEVVNVDAFSAHADYEELIGWLKNMTKAPSRLFLTHGEPAAAESFKSNIKKYLGWESVIARDLEEVSLS